MEKINFSKEYVKPILEGRKKTTIRKGLKRYSASVQLVVDAETFAKARVKKVVVKRVKELTEEDAINDGFKNLDELMTALRKIYGDLKANEFVTILHFEIL
jgi:hypothetical protein